MGDCVYPVKNRARLPLFAVLLLVLGVLLLAGCGSKKDADNEANAANETNHADSEEPAVDREPEAPAYRYMLNGLPVEQEVKRRPVMVMIENQKAARPQSGLMDADVIYEVLTEGEITRFAAIFQSREPELMGPVRSIRPYFIRIGKELDGLIIHAGWSPEAKNILLSGGYPYINQVHGGDWAYFWRSTDRKAPHNVYTSMELIKKGWKDKKYRDDWAEHRLSFLEPEETVGDGQDVRHVKIDYVRRYYYVEYQYDEEKGVYLRSMDGQPHVDRESNTQLAAANILICRSEHKIVDKAGRRDVDILGPGSGYLLQQGKMREIEWKMQDGLIRAYIDGVEQKLVPGQTWIQIVPMNAPVTFQ